MSGLSTKRVAALAGSVVAAAATWPTCCVPAPDALCAGNILLDAQGRAKVADFGLARCKSSHAVLTRRPETGTGAYLAPECWLIGEGVASITEHVDVYSFGVCVWELCTGERPWSGMRMREFIEKASRLGASLHATPCFGSRMHSRASCVSLGLSTHPSSRS
jgi:serine/threonine protein kinase